MGRKLWRKEQLVTAQYDKRCDAREVKLMEATMGFVAYFIALDASGDIDEVKLTNANIKVAQVSTLVAHLLYAYRLGNTQPLIDAVNAVDVGVLTFMDADAKTFLATALT